jgi:hypothetical protein
MVPSSLVVRTGMKYGMCSGQEVTHSKSSITTSYPYNAQKLLMMHTDIKCIESPCQLRTQGTQ